VDRIAHEVAASGGRFSSLLTSITQSAPFQTRRGDDGALKIAPRLAIPEAPPPELRKGRPFDRRPFERPPEAERPPRNPVPAPAANSTNAN
jgi:hypothetical protein